MPSPVDATMKEAIVKLSAVAAFGVVALVSLPAKAVECHDNVTPVAGWASPVSVFSGQQMFNADCFEAGTQVTIGDGERKTFVYETAYYRQSGGAWTEFTLSGDGKTNGYYRESAVALLPVEEDVDIAAYVCERIGGQWKCGCEDEACATPYWGFQQTTWPTTPTPPPSGSDFVSQVAECTGPTIDVTPATLPGVLENNDNVTLRLAPGEYNYEIKANGSCVKLTCSQPAIVNGQGNWSNGCILNRLPGLANTPGTGYSAILTWPQTGRIIVERMVIATNIDSLGSQNHARYGIRLFNTEEVRITNNWFEANTNHEVSSKYNVGYMEIFDNIFNNCQAICIENGQDPNLTAQPSMSGKLIVTDNIFDGAEDHTIVNRNIVKTEINNNTFTNGNVAIRNWPVWREYYGEKPRIPNVNQPGAAGYGLPLETNITNNTFNGNNRLLLQGRGLDPSDDQVYLKNNTGSFNCGRYGMDAFNSNASNAHSNEVSTAPPSLASGSDACPAQ